MDLKVLKWHILRGSLARRLLLRTLFFALAMAVISMFQIVHDVRSIEQPPDSNFHECPLSFSSNPYLNFTGFLNPMYSLAIPLFGRCKETENLTIKVLFKELMERKLLDSDAKALCVGEGSASAVLALRELGFSNAFGVDRHPFFSILRKRFVYELDFKDNYFDFVFSRALDRVSVPALLVLEIERVLRPGGTGAMLLGASNFYSGGLIRSATPVSSFLRSSNVVHICGVGAFSLVIFKKRFDKVEFYEHYRLPSECRSMTNNKPFINLMEPLEGGENLGPLETKFSYLPKFMNISSRKRLIYVNIGAGEFVNYSVSEMLKRFYPIETRAFEIYVVDHDISALLSHVKKPGVTFVYHPGLAGEKAIASLTSDEYLSAPLDDEEFDFIRWFKRTVGDDDFVVLVMNARAGELQILFELFESGAICHVDEVFLRCSDGVDCMNDVCGDCASLFRGLRNSGVFVHRWLGN